MGTPADCCAGVGVRGFQHSFVGRRGKGDDSQACTVHSQSHTGTPHSAGRQGRNFLRTGTSEQKTGPEGTRRSPPPERLYPMCLDI